MDGCTGSQYFPPGGRAGARLIPREAAERGFPAATGSLRELTAKGGEPGRAAGSRRRVSLPPLCLHPRARPSHGPLHGEIPGEEPGPSLPFPVPSGKPVPPLPGTASHRISQALPPPHPGAGEERRRRGRGGDAGERHMSIYLRGGAGGVGIPERSTGTPPAGCRRATYEYLPAGRRGRGGRCRRGAYAYPPGGNIRSRHRLRPGRARYRETGARGAPGGAQPRSGYPGTIGFI